MKIKKDDSEYIIEIENLLEEQKFNILLELMEKINIQSLEEIQRNYNKKSINTEKTYLTKENDEYTLKSITTLKDIKKI